jgi:transmembrane sensor
MAMAGIPGEQLVEQALTLIVQSEVAPGASADQARLTLDHWCGHSPAHEAAAREARRRWDALSGLSGELRTHFEAPAAADAGQRRRRRQLLLSVAALAGLGVLGERGLQWQLRQPLFATSYTTPTAQVRQVVLPDGAGGAAGSLLDLGPQTAVDVVLHRQRRSVDLLRGEVRLAVSPDAERPFVVTTREARIEVVGTAFTVRDRGGPVTIGVEHGHVRVRVQRREAGAAASATMPAGSAIDLRPGQVLSIRGGVSEPLQPADPTALSAWREGWLVFDNVPLGDALATINAYRARPIRSSDPRIDRLRLSGRFRSSDSAGLVAALPAILPLSTRTHPDGSVELRTR